MKKNGCKTCFVRQLCLIIFVLSVIIATNENITYAGIISDPVVESAVRVNINKPTGVITAEDCMKVTDLNINMANLPTVKILEAFPNLERLILSNSRTTDISSLSKLKKLKYVALGGSAISSLEPLTSLPNLGGIELSQTIPVNLEPLGRIKSLWHINLLHVPIKDLNIFNNLTNLRILNLYSNQISDVSPLSKHKQMVVLGLGRNLISDIRPLASLTNLTNLGISESEVSSISDIQYVIKNMKLEALFLYENPIRDYSALKPFYEKLGVREPYMWTHYQDIQALALKCSEIIDDIINPSMSEVEKELAIHDYIVNNTEYDYSISSISGDANGPILFGKGICDGYSQAFTLLTRYLGFECFVVTGHVGSFPVEEDEINIGHAWNKIRIGGVLHNVDTTWNDTADYLYYEYFNCSDVEMSNHWEHPLYPKAPGGDAEWIKYAYPELGDPVKVTLKITLPDNEKAFATPYAMPYFNGVPIAVKIVNLQMKGVSDIKFQRGFNVVIPSGQNSVVFTTWIPSDMKMINIVYNMPVSRVIKKTSNERNWLTSGYQLKNGMYNELDINQVYTSDDFKNKIVEIKLEKGVNVTGKIQLPPGYVNTNEVDVSFYGMSGNTSLILGTTIFMPKGKTSGEYSIVLPKNSAYKLNFYTSAIGCENTTYLNADGLSATMSDYKVVTGDESISLPLLTVPYSAQHTGAIFNDVKKGSQLETNAVTLYMKGVLSGDGKGNVLPNSLVSRAEFAAMLVKMKGSEALTKSITSCRFVDVGKTKWYMQYVEVAAKLELLSGTGNGNFSPEGNVTGVQALYAICRLFTTSESLTQTYPDKNWKEVAVLAAKDFGIIDVSEIPSETAITREQVIKYLVVALEKLE